jgi:hypothetical protein
MTHSDNTPYPVVMDGNDLEAKLGDGSVDDDVSVV